MCPLHYPLNGFTGFVKQKVFGRLDIGKHKQIKCNNKNRTYYKIRNVEFLPKFAVIISPRASDEFSFFCYRLL